MKTLASCLLALGLASLSMAGGKPLANVPKFSGGFTWIKLGALPTSTAKALAGTKSILVTVTFRKDVHLKKDKGGNQWFTLILSDQGSDWAWHQTSGSGLLPMANGVIKAGTYAVAIPTAGIPKTVLADKMQTVSVGPGSSGLAAPIAFSIDSLKGK